MPRPPREDSDRLLTEAELELMNILWDLGEGSVRDVMAGLPPERELAYTSVSTILRILEQKGFVASRKRGRGNAYRPLLDRPAYQGRSLDRLTSRLFGGDPLSLVRRLISARQLSADELQSLQRLVEEELDDGPDGGSSGGPDSDGGAAT